MTIQEEITCTHYPSSTWVVSHCTRGRGRNPNASLYIKSHVLRGEQISELLETSSEDPIQGKPELLSVSGGEEVQDLPQMLRGSSTVPESGSRNASGSAESCGHDLHGIEKGHSPARVFHQEQRAAWSVGNAGSVPLSAHPSP